MDDGGSAERSVVYGSPMGPLKLTATEEGIAAVKYLFGKYAEPTEGKQAVKESEDGVNWSKRLLDYGSEAVSHLRVCCEWLDAYFAGKLLTPDPPPRPKLAFSKKGLLDNDLYCLKIISTYCLECSHTHTRWFLPHCVVRAVQY